MFKIGDSVIYSVHGLSKIDDICERTFNGVTKNYYVIRPMNDTNLKISIPVDSDKAVIQKTLDKEEAEEILQTFNQSG
ncbi:CarD family transcriptional regulator [Oceanobacillus saliphilus]|uniref:CarD family transcriptional regulator n=1 Tax=Oceanobacillus saliphilus TaxID=2925834 RepID=UPI00201D5985|nr:CarD family transcriptional regulator [Oceanobacillus saliphilus]